jgi:hypothetical protein
VIDVPQLPKSAESICHAIEKHAVREQGRIAFRRVMWLIAYYYLNGARRFDLFNPGTGTIRPHFVDENGQMEFQSQDLLYNINQVSGRLASMDVRPLVIRSDLSLPGLRDRSVGQVMLSSLVSDDQLRTVKRDFAFLFTCLGCCGIQGHIVDHPTIGLTSDIEVVHPTQIYPFPSLGQDFTRQHGLMRERFVTLDFLKEKFGAKKIAANLDKLDWYERVTGSVIENQPNDASMQAGGYRNWADTHGGTPTSKETYRVARVRELWLNGPRGTCARYVVCSGMALLADEDFSGQEMYCPLGFARFFDNGSFHGAGMFDLMFPIARQLEKLTKSLFNNVNDLDQYGIIVLPHGAFNERAALRDVGRGLRVLPFEPDPVMENFRPFSIQPWNTGDLPGKTAMFAKQMMESINPIADLLKEKGRVDSERGLRFLDEKIREAMTNPSSGIEQAWGTMYRGCATQAVQELMVSPRPLPVSRLTLDLAGAVIDPKEHTVSFTDNPIPDLSRLSFTIKNTIPGSEVALKAEAVEMARLRMDMGQPDWDGFVLFSLKKGLDFAMWADEEQSAYEAVVRNCLLLFGDGEAPGEIVLTPAIAKPEFQMRVLTAFMSHPRMSLASPEVQDAFTDYRATLIDFMGLTLPAHVPNPDDAALLRQAEMQMSGALPQGQ